MNSTGWRKFRRYLLESLTKYWDSLSVLEQHRILFDMIELDRDARDTQASPSHIWGFLEEDFKLVVSSLPACILLPL